MKAAEGMGLPLVRQLFMRELNSENEHSQMEGIK